MTVQDPEERVLLLLQAAGWMGQFRTLASTRGDGLREVRITDRDITVEKNFSGDALRHTVSKADEVHYYKYAAALVEDSRLVSAACRPRLLSALRYYVKGPADAEPAPMKRAREALGV